MFNKKGGKEHNEWLSIRNDVKCPTMLISLFDKSINLVQEDSQTSWQNKLQAKCKNQPEPQHMHDVCPRGISQGSSPYQCSLPGAGLGSNVDHWFDDSLSSYPSLLPSATKDLPPKSSQISTATMLITLHHLILVLHFNHPRATLWPNPLVW